MLENALGVAGLVILVLGGAVIAWWREARLTEQELKWARRDLDVARREMAIQLGEAKYWMARAQGEAEKAQQAINFLDHGRVDRKPAKTIDTDGFEERVDKDARSIEAVISADSIERGIEALGNHYDEEGLSRPPAAELRSEVEQLFNASSNAEGQIE